MHIDSIEVFHLALPRVEPLATSLGPLTTLETVLVRMNSGGLHGWGEATPGNAPLTGAEWAAGVFACIRDWLGPAVVGHNVRSGGELDERLLAFQGNRFAKAALDTAWWDLHARHEGKPLDEVLGGQRKAIELGVSFDRMDSQAEFLAAIAEAFDAGFARVALKMRPGWDVNMLDAVRREFPTERLHADVEGALRLDDMEILARLDDFGLAMVEQPLPADDLVGMAMVQDTIHAPVCLDEAIATLEQAGMALELKSGQYVNVTPGRVGGLTTAVAIHDACHEQCVPCYVGATPQTAIGVRHGLALASKANFSYPAEYVRPERLLREDVAESPRPERQPDSKVAVELWPQPGIGVEPDAKRIDAFCLARAEIKAQS